VIVEADPSIESDDPEDEPASVSIYFADGSSRSADVRGGLGSLTVPMTDEQLIGKYRRLAGPVIGAEAVAALEQRVLLLASDPDVSDLMSALAGTGAGTGPAPTQRV
jgi:hypothetical protein